VVRIVERPKPGETTTHYINAGQFVFPPAIFDLLRQVQPSPRGEYELTDAIRMLLDAGQTILAYDLTGFWVNITDPPSYLEAQRELFAEGGCPAAPATAGVEVHGPVAVGAGCRLAPCQLGPDVSLGETCTVGQAAVVRDAIVMAGAAIGAGARVESAVVGLGARVREGVQLVGDPDGRVPVVMHGDLA
jgi:bifunctional UDP-N-acetylglucosamine pyrophosphorylase/glucosamine-1-phosphate N-acetyltransferase